MQSSTWLEGEDQDVYEVESRVPLPRPFPLCSTLNDKNAVVVQTQISHVNHSTDGHLLKVISRISLPTPPYTVSLYLGTHPVLATVFQMHLTLKAVPVVNILYIKYQYFIELVYAWRYNLNSVAFPRSCVRLVF